MKIKKSLLLGLFSFLLYSFASVYITYPLLFHMGDLATGLGDELMIAWTQNWVMHALTTNPLLLFEANLYFPFHNTLAYSDLHLTSSILATIPFILTGQAITFVNFTLILSLVLLGFSLYILCYYLTKDFGASILVGILIIFSPAVLDKVIHLQILAVEWVPLAILFFFIFFDKQKTKYLVYSLICFLLQTYNSFMPGYFILFSYVIIFFYKWIYQKKQTIKIITKKNSLLVIFSFFFLLPIIIPYYQVSKEFNYTRDIRDAVHLALQPEDMFYTNEKSRLYPFLNGLPFNQYAQNGEFKPGYVGFIFTVLIIIVIWRFIKNFRKNGYFFNSFITISLLGLVLSLGPVLHLGRQTVHIPFPIPLPYSLFYYFLPGFQGFRNSARWEMLFILAIGVAIALVLNDILKKYSVKGKIIIYFILIVGCVLEFNYPLHYVNIVQRKNFPLVYSWLDKTPKNTSVIILPAYNWNMHGAGEEIQRDYFSTSNFRRTINGYSGFSPPPWQDLLVLLQKKVPQSESVKILKDMRVDYIIVDKKEYDTLFVQKWSQVDGITVVNNFKNNPGLLLVEEFGDTFVFKLVK
jgi:hypothetical protein